MTQEKHEPRIRDLSVLSNEALICKMNRQEGKKDKRVSIPHSAVMRLKRKNPSTVLCCFILNIQ